MVYTNTLVEHLLETKAKGKSTLADIVRTKWESLKIRYHRTLSKNISMIFLHFGKIVVMRLANLGFMTSWCSSRTNSSSNKCKIQT